MVGDVVANSVDLVLCCCGGEVGFEFDDGVDVGLDGAGFEHVEVVLAEVIASDDALGEAGSLACY